MAIQNPVTICVVDNEGESVVQSSTSGAAHVDITSGGALFTPSDYDTDLTMDATGEVVVLATGVALGIGKVQIANRGASTEDIRVAFGTSEANALANLNIAAGAATTGYYLPAAAEGGSQSVSVLGVPATSTHVAVGPATAADTQAVAVTQGK